MGELQEFFELPRKDWYDEKGRIFKDRIIENLNAIEKKIKQVINLDPWGEEAPDVSKFEFDDVTLDSPENKIVNLKSLVTILNLVGYPLECTFSGKTCAKLSYYDEGYNYVTLKDVPVDCSDSKKYIVLNYSTNKLSAKSSVTFNSTEVLIGVYCDSRIRTVNEDNPVGINVLRYLAKMSLDTFDVTFDSGTRDWYDCASGIVRDGRSIGAGDTNTRTWGPNPVTFLDVGRRSE